MLQRETRRRGRTKRCS